MNVSPDDAPALTSLAALLPGGLGEVDATVARHLRSNDLAEALKTANARYAQSQGRNIRDTLTYAILLTHRELASEALGVLRKGMTYHAADIGLQLAQVDALFAGGDLDAAAALMEALSVSLREPRHWAYLGDMYWDLDERESARAAYEEATTRGSQAADVALRLADIYADDGMFWEAAECFERAGRLSPSDPHIWFAVTEAWLGLGAWERAVYSATRTTKLAADDDEAWALLGAAQREAGSPGDALTAFERARNLDPMNPTHWLNLGGLQLELGLPEQARQSYLRASSLDATEVEAINGQVAAAFELGDVDLARQLAARALKVEPDNADALYNLGVISLSLHDAPQARDAFERGLRNSPLNPHMIVGRATSLLMMGEVDEAVVAVHTALEFEATDVELILEFVELLFRHGGTDEVLRFLESAVCDDPAWEVVLPVFEFTARALRREPVDAATQRFVDAVMQHPEILPVPWDFEEVARLGFGLDPWVQQRLDVIIAILDGRDDIETLRTPDVDRSGEE